ncbi:hypothetical protein [Shewanella surugensis]|uniref:Uncharacterized protein n=1 Tax=Shewanella surugensis TaxID=212020 RepID=A0ABT0L6I0_9GAMM|nr:hypothetical protein [Shewanella surugensis]MCL1123293.1 hypothetical protein [Shewanella surugensis]
MAESVKLTKVLTIGGQPVINIVSDHVQLDLFSTGRAIFVVCCESEPSGLVELHLGYQVSTLIPYFLGVIEKKHFSQGMWFLTCRELIGALSFPAPLAIRFATLKHVLSGLSLLGVEFVYPEAEYINNPVPCFHHSGDGVSALRSLGRIYQITDYIFQQRSDGKIYVGSWHDSGWANNPITDFSEHPIVTKTATTGRLLVIPKMRPGIKLNGRYITQVVLSKNTQEITWSKTLLSA